MKTLVLKDGTSLSSFLTQVIDEGMKSALAQKALTEKEKQDATVSSMGGDKDSSGDGGDDLFGGSGDGEGSEDDSSEESTSSKTMDDETEKLQKGDIEPKDIVDKLNAIRGGKSFKDSTVANSMEEYIGSLSKAEKVALMAFLKGISQIVTGEVPSQDAADPSDSPSDVKMQKGEPKDVKHVQPNVIKGKAPGGEQEKPKSGAEDTSAPAPITPKKR